MISAMNPERYGEKVNNDPMKYAMQHFRMLRYKGGRVGIVGNFLKEYHLELDSEWS